MKPDHRPYKILTVEDNPTDVLLLKEALSEHQIPYEIFVLPDGEKALNHMKGLAESSRPDLIILDLNLPKFDGFGVLDQYRLHEILKSVPIVILTSSDSPADRRRAQNVGVAAFFQKPMTLEGFIALGPRFRAILETPNNHATAGAGSN